MAVFPSLPGIEITVIDAEGKPFEEYDDNDAQDEQDGVVKDISKKNSTKSKKTTKHPATDSVRRYIEARTNQEFGLRFAIKPPFVPSCPTIGFCTQIDGAYAHEIINIFNKNKSQERVTSLMGIQDGQEERPFKFSKISASSESDLLDSDTEGSKNISDFGTIMISVWREGKARKAPRRSSRNNAFDAPLELREEDLKGLTTSHSTLLGDSREKSKRTYRAKRLDKSPIAKVTLKYRSKEALKQLLIIPRTPEPSPEPEPTLPPEREATMDDLDEDARRTVKELIQKLANPGTAAAAKIKLERNCSNKIKYEINEGGSSKIKREREEHVSLQSSSRKRSKIPGEKVTISLSDDEGIDALVSSTRKDMGENNLIDLTDD